MNLKTTFLWAMILSLALATALGVVAILFDSLGDTGERILVSSLLVGSFSLVCLACSFVLNRYRLATVMKVGIGASLVALAIWLGAIWLDRYPWPDIVEELVWKSGSTFTTIALWAAHLGLIMLHPIERQSWRVVRSVTLWLTGLLCIVIIAIFWTEEFEEWSAKLIGVLSILAACGTVVTPILALIEKLQNRGAPATVGERVSIQVTCPRCGEAQAIKAGRDKCSSCGLRIEINVQEPRCTCGYLLYKLEGDSCPECGRTISEGEKWKAAAGKNSEARE